eukprot:TRINITY_DN12229_c5_g2_i3.p1 TRINITY_DN12229_c5_g2~~TRINITY_DN12229_c5_g2_i3.p1  ORF type:complete len:455 (+),score=82.70 TRINITY_DN12229_c5_g2_i3:135-1499(+)
MIFPYTSRTLLSRARFVAGRWLHSACIRQTKPHLRQPSSPSLVAAVSSTGHLELHLSERVTGVMTPETITVDPLWACHQCCCPSCIQQGSGQRMQVPPDHLIPDLLKDVNQDEEFIYLHWQHNPHATVLSLAQVEQSLAQQLPHAPATPCTHLAKHDFALVAKDDYALWECLNSIAQDGACLLKSAPVIVTGCDNSSSAAMDGVVALANRISQPQPTFYGTTFDVVATDNPINIAYSNVALDLHQDLVYYESPPGLQFLHAVSFPEEVTGGESILMDAFAIAQRLREAHPDAFDTLTRMPMVFEKVHYNRKLPVHLVAKKNLITVDDNDDIVDVVWAPPFEGVQPIRPLATSRAFFDAYSCFARLIQESIDLLVEHRLQEGEMLCFNNRRMLHGRREFNLPEGAIRHLKASLHLEAKRMFAVHVHLVCSMQLFSRTSSAVLIMVCGTGYLCQHR